MNKIDGKHANKREILKDKNWKPFKQTFIVYAKQMWEDFEVETEHGVLKGMKGDYLVMGPQGNKWPLSKKTFDLIYEKL